MMSSCKEYYQSPLEMAKMERQREKEEKIERNIGELSRIIYNHNILNFLSIHKNYIRANCYLNRDAKEILLPVVTHPSYEAFKTSLNDFSKQSQYSSEITEANLEVFKTMQKEFLNFSTILLTEITRSYYTKELKAILKEINKPDVSKDDIRNQIVTLTTDTLLHIIDCQKSSAIQRFLLEQKNEKYIYSMVSEFHQRIRKTNDFDKTLVEFTNAQLYLEENYKLFFEDIGTKESIMSKFNEKDIKSKELLKRNAEKFADAVLYRIENENHYTVWQTISNMVNDFIEYLGTIFNIEGMKPINQKLGLDTETAERLNPKVIAKETEAHYWFRYGNREISIIGDEFKRVRESLKNRPFVSRLQEEEKQTSVSK